MHLQLELVGLFRGLGDAFANRRRSAGGAGMKGHPLRWVHGFGVDVESPMNMGASGSTGRTNVADDIGGSNLLALFGLKFRHV